MNKSTRTIEAVAVFTTLALLTTPLLATPLPSDSRIVTGKLANGVTWMYRQHDNPPGKMAMIMHVDTGSLNETDGQRGLAHFLEHMAFNGTENFAPGKLLPYFESIGMEFGNDLNAFTSFDQTAYMLFAPDTETAQLDKALMCLSDYAFRMLLLDEEIDKERGIILEEKRTGKNAFQRIRDQLYPELYEGSRFAARIVIGKEEIIAKAPRGEFVDYYRTWYRPENITVVLVGDTSRDRVAPLVEKWFGKYQPAVPTRKKKGPEFNPFQSQRAIVVTDPEMAFCDVSMVNIRPGRPPVTTVEQWQTKLVEHVGTWILDRRFDERVKKGEASYREAYANVGDFFHDALRVSVNAEGEPEDWPKMIEELVMEVNRAGEYGFTARELELARKEILAEAEREVRTEPTRNARRFLFEILHAVNHQEPILSAQQELDLYSKYLGAVTLAEVNEILREHFRPGTFAYVVEMVEKEGVQVPARDDVLAAARAAWSRKVKPMGEDAAPTDLLASMPTPGKVVDYTVDQDLDITSAWLSNGVRVHHRFMDYKEDTVMMSIALAGGEIEETAANAHITEVASLAVNEAATSRLTSTNIRDIMTGKNIKVSAGGEGDSLTVRVQGSPNDLEVGLQLARAVLTDGKIEESAFENWRLQTLQRIDMLNAMPRFKAMEAVLDLLSGGDPRRKMIAKKDVERQSLEAAQKWFDRLCREAPIEVAVVGDIPWATAKPLIEKYLGSLPNRSRAAKHLDRLRRLARPTGPLSRRVDVATMTPQATAAAGFAGSEGRNTFDTRGLHLAANVLDSRLVKRIREELAWVYSIHVYNRPGWVYPDAGMFASGAPCDPNNADKLADEIHAMFQEFAEKGPTEEELDNAKKQIANNLDEDMKEPRYWWSVLAHFDLHGRNLDDEKGKVEDYQRYTAAQVRDVFRKYYQTTRQFRVTAIPSKAEAEESETIEEAVTAPTS